MPVAELMKGSQEEGPMRFKTSLRFLITPVVCFACGFAGTVFATPYNGLYVFGDSLSDAGNAYQLTGGILPVSPVYSQGRFTDGDVWVQDLARRVGLGAVTPSLAGGNDFAFGGAQTGTTLVHRGNPTDLNAQFAAYQAAVTDPKPNALYTLWIGSNDVDALVSALGDAALSPKATNIGKAQVAHNIGAAGINTDIAQAVDNVGAVVDRLAASGMNNLLVLNVPDLSKTPNAIAAAALTANPMATLAEIQALTGRFDTALDKKLTMLSQTDGFTLSLVDIYGIVDQIAAHPAAFGLTNSTDPCWTGNFTDAASGRVCSSPNSYLFWDNMHPTAAGHRLIANIALRSLPIAVPEPANGGLFMLALSGIIMLSVSRWQQKRARRRIWRLIIGPKAASKKKQTQKSGGERRH
jgi:phospholipase/lecithinase/hemolysin